MARLASFLHHITSQCSPTYVENVRPIAAAPVTGNTAMAMLHAMAASSVVVQSETKTYDQHSSVWILPDDAYTHTSVPQIDLIDTGVFGFGLFRNVAVDTDGRIWVCHNDKHEIWCFTDDKGQLIRVMSDGVRTDSCCMHFEQQHNCGRRMSF